MFLCWYYSYRHCCCYCVLSRVRRRISRPPWFDIGDRRGLISATTTQYKQVDEGFVRYTRINIAHHPEWRAHSRLYIYIVYTAITAKKEETTWTLSRSFRTWWEKYIKKSRSCNNQKVAARNDCEKHFKSNCWNLNLIFLCCMSITRGFCLEE